MASASAAAGTASDSYVFQFPGLNPENASDYDEQEVKDLLARYGVPESDEYLKVIKTMRNMDPDQRHGAPGSEREHFRCSIWLRRAE